MRPDDGCAPQWRPHSRVPLAAAGPKWYSLQLGWPLGTDYRDTSVRQYVRDPQNELPSHWNLEGAYKADVRLPAAALYSGHSTDGVQLWVDPQADDEHLYLVFRERVERWPRAEPIVACG
jgi:hypothetical protein